jgi:zinc transport system substrate-binding protein
MTLAIQKHGVSAKRVTELIQTIENENIPVIFYEELTEPQVAKLISNQTGAKMLLLHSAHNVSKEDFEKGITYLDIMRENLENLKEALN